MTKKQQEAAVVEALAKGNFVYANTLTGAQQWTAGTVKVVASVGSALVRMMFPYLRFRFSAWDSAGAGITFTYWVVRTTEATLDLSDAAILEQYMKEGKIFMRGQGMFIPIASGQPFVLNLKFFNITLEEDEYLRLLVMPKNSTAAATMNEWLEREYREIALD